MRYQIKQHLLLFNFIAGTSRGNFTQKPTFFIAIYDQDNNCGLGECSPLPGLSIDYTNDSTYFKKIDTFLQYICKNKININSKEWDSFLINSEIKMFPSILFGIETALLTLANKDAHLIYNTTFTSNNTPIPINGLLWMGTKEFMLKQLEEKISAGFTCIKMKIGAIDFDSEFDLIKTIRNNYTQSHLTIRLDANGAFTTEEALYKLNEVKQFDIHSIEQPIKKGAHSACKSIIDAQIIPIALDEELIGINSIEEKNNLLTYLKPDYIILKPSLHGGFVGCDEWIEVADSLNIKWWITSALEANIGLNAIAQYTKHKNAYSYQGLGTGSLYHNNIESPLKVDKGLLFYEKAKKWQTIAF